MKNLLKLPAFLVLLTLSTLLTSCVASTQAVAVRPVYYPPRPAYYYPPRPRVIVAPAPRLVRPRPVIVTPARPYYYHARPHRYIRVR